MNVIIVGCGQVGKTLASRLGGDGNNVTVVDTNAARVRELVDKIDVMGVVGNGSSHTTLKDAGIGSADLLIAVTDSDELNLLCCILAKKSGSCRTIARVRDKELSQEAEYLKRELELAMVINPELATAKEIARVLRFPTAISIEPFAKGLAELIKFKLPQDSGIVGLSVKETASRYKCDVLFCTVERGDVAYIPTGDFVFEPKDVISIVASHENATEFFGHIGFRSHAIRDAIILGGGRVSEYLCNLFPPREVKFKLIENSLPLCESLCTELTHVTVVQGDYSDRELLEEEGILDADAFLSLSEDDEDNVLASLYARTKEVKKVVTRINRIEFDGMIKHLDLDTVIYPKNIVADNIVRYVRATSNTRGSNMETLYNVIPGEVEACEFIVKEESDVTGVPLSKLSLKRDILIAAIMRNGEVIIPRGQDEILPGDSVIIISRETGLHDITDILDVDAER